MTPEQTLAGLESLRRRYVRLARNRVATRRWKRARAEHEYRALAAAIGVFAEWCADRSEVPEVEWERAA